MDVKGTQITAVRGHMERTRDAQKFKKIHVANPNTYESQREPFIVHPARSTTFRFFADPAVATSNGNIEADNVPNQRSVRPQVQPTADVGETQQSPQRSVEPPTNDMRAQEMPFATRGRLAKLARKQKLLRNLQGGATPD